jgi:hypothetical protein
VVGEFGPPSTVRPNMMDASERTPSKGESPTVESAAQQQAVYSAVSAQFQLLRDGLHTVPDAIRDGEPADRDEMLAEVEEARAHLDVIETLVREYGQDEE